MRSSGRQISYYHGPTAMRAADGTSLMPSLPSFPQRQTMLRHLIAVSPDLMTA